MSHIRAFEVHAADIERCPIQSMSAKHYRDDGTCLCVKEEPSDEAREAQAAYDDAWPPPVELPDP